MGLFMYAYSKMVFVHKEAKCLEDDHIRISSLDTFVERLDGRQEGCYVCKGKEKSIFSVTYSYYAQWRDLLSYLALKISAWEVVYPNPEEHKDKPFFKLICMSDTEGTIGPVTSKKLAEDFQTLSFSSKSNKKMLRELIKKEGFDFYGDMTVEEQVKDWLYTYSKLRKGFTLASDEGFVIFG